MLTRRTFLQGAAAIASVPVLPRQALSPPAKLISLGGPTALTPGSVHDYRAWGNREDVLATGTRWVKIWLAWSDVQPTPETELEDAPGLRVIDDQVAAANADSVRVMLCVTGGAPLWAGDPAARPPPRRSATGRFPLERGPDSPWGRFAAHLIARYRGGLATFGNPSGAVVDAIELGNEPNLVSWPRAEAPRAAAEMLRTADALSAELGGPTVLGPATSDTQGYLEFTRAVLAELRGWRPLGSVGWSHHNYVDMDRQTTKRLAAVRDALEAAAWPGGRAIWLTEGGYDMTRSGTVVTAAARRRQAEILAGGYSAARGFSAAAERAGRIGVLPTFAQHCVHDQDAPWNTFKSGLRDDFSFALSRPGAPRPAWYAWRDLG